MKTRITLGRFWGLVLVLAPGFGALGQDAVKSSTSGHTEKTPATVAPTAAKPADVGEKPLADMLVRPVPAPREGPNSKTRPLPFKGYVSPWVTEVARLAQAGIEDDVLLAFVNAAGTFNLSSEQIINLRDLGVSGPVIAAMMQHDLGFPGQGTMPVAASSPTLAALKAAGITSGQAQASTAKPASPPSPPPPGSGLDEDSSIINPFSQDTADDILAPEFPDWGPYWVGPTELSQPAGGCAHRCASAGTTVSSPVRAPYPVKLTDPIVMYRAPARIPNVVVIEMFP